MLSDSWNIISKAPKEVASSSEILIREPSILECVSNRIYFYAEIDRVNVLKLNTTLRQLSNSTITDTKIQNLSSVTPIRLHINSYGGNIFAGLAAMDEILNCDTDVHTVVDGCCASAGTFLSVVGKKRYINKHAFMLIHQLSSFMWGKYEAFKDEMTNLDRIMSMIKDVYKQHTKVPQKELDKILKHDIWWDANTCLKYGMVDEIV